MTRRFARAAWLRAAAALIAAATAPLAAAQESPYASPRWGAFEVSLSGYRPRIDAEFGGAAAPYQTAFGGGRGLMFRADFAKSLMTEYGELDVGIGGGYWEKLGHGLLPDGSVSGDSTLMRVIPSRLSVTYRFDYLANRYPIPLAPYVRFSLERYWWWIYNGSGGVAQADGKSGKGATNGYSFSAGVAFLLDFIDRGLARDMDRNTGINHTYVFVDFTKSFIDDFGSASSWDMSDDKVTISGGLLFLF